MKAIVTRDLKAEMRNILLHAGAGAAGLLVTSLFHLEHRQQWRVFCVIVHLAVVLVTTGFGSCTARSNSFIGSAGRANSITGQKLSICSLGWHKS